jgi:hypothetical protein
MWPKLLTANATEAIAEKGDRSETMPSVAEVAAFLKDAEAGAASKRALTQFVELETRHTARALYLETRRSNGMWVYKYAIRLPANQILQQRIGYLLKRPATGGRGAGEGAVATAGCSIR